jgi:hypothetical protein
MPFAAAGASAAATAPERSKGSRRSKLNTQGGRSYVAGDVACISQACVGGDC